MIGRLKLQVNTVEFKKMHEDGVKIVDIALYFGISKSSVNKMRVQLNMSPRRFRVRYDENKYLRMFNEGVSYPMMAKKLDISEWMVMEVRKRLGLSTRKRGRKRIRRLS